MLYHSDDRDMNFWKIPSYPPHIPIPPLTSRKRPDSRGNSGPQQLQGCHARSLKALPFDEFGVKVLGLGLFICHFIGGALHKNPHSKWDLGFRGSRFKILGQCGLG